MTALFKEYDLLSRSQLFDPEYYRAQYPDVAAANVDPLLHYMEKGAREGRNPSAGFNAAYYLEQCRQCGEEPANPLLHFLTVGNQRAPVSQARPVSAFNPSAKPSADPETGVVLHIERLEVQPSGRGRRLRCEGWAIAPQPVLGLSARLGEALLGRASYGLTRPDVAQSFPRYPKADHSGFRLDIEQLPLEEEGKSQPLTFEVRTAAGVVYRRDVRLEGADATEGTSGEGSPAMQLHVDPPKLSADGVLTVSGWAIAFVEIEKVDLFIDDEHIGPADFGREREDLAKTWPDYPNAGRSGFRYSSAIAQYGAGERIVKVQATARSGVTREVLIPLTVPDLEQKAAAAEEFHFHCDEVILGVHGHLFVKGWAVGAAPTSSIAVFFDDAKVGVARIGEARADVGNYLPFLPHARNAGFIFQTILKHGPLSGEHTVLLKFLDAQGAERTLPLAALARDVRVATSPAAPADAGPQHRYFLDSPRINNGAAEQPVRGSMMISGWALVPEGIESVSIAVDGKPAGNAYYGIRRLDVQEALPDLPGSLLSGFGAHLPRRLLPVGPHDVVITIADKGGASSKIEFKIQAEDAAEGPGPWLLRRKISYAEAKLCRGILAGLQWAPQFTLLLVIPRMDEGVIRQLRRTLATLGEQIYYRWQARLIVSAAPSNAQQTRLFEDFEDLRGKIEFMQSRGNVLFTQLLGKAAAGYLALLSPGDELGCDALMELAIASGQSGRSELVYSDERLASPVSGVMDAYFKPQWSPDLLLSNNYLGRLWCVDAGVLERIQASTKELLEFGEYDLALRATEAAKSIRHVPKVLCQRALKALDPPERERRALVRALDRRGVRAKVEKGCAPGIYRVRRRVEGRGLVSIIIPTCAGRGLIKICLETLRQKTAYRNYEIICIENIQDDKADWKQWLRKAADKVIETSEPFNWSRFNNLCVEQARGEYLLFLNDDIEIIQPDWLDALLEHAQRPEVGAVGPQLLYPDRTVQHAGVLLNTVGRGRHAFRHLLQDEPGYFGLALTQRNVIAVTGACLLTRRETFEAVGRFDEAHTVVNNDLDYCLRLWERGLLNVFTPHTLLIHHEQASRGELGDDYDTSGFDSRWRELFALGDPYLNPNLSRDYDEMVFESEPVRVICPGRPLFARDSVQRILILKLDHIGDCITALPAIRLLKRQFPQARLSVASSPDTAAIWSAEDSVDEVIEFRFFHAQSGKGEARRAKRDLQALQEALESRRFDLAIDLRKRPDTRHLLQLSGARLSAGFDHRGKFPWLDVALEWQEDLRTISKRQHVSDDLIDLINAVVASSEGHRDVLQIPRSARQAPAEKGLRNLFKKPVVAIHHGSGNPVKMWPLDYYRDLIDLLVNDGVNVAIVGGESEKGSAAALIEQVRQPQAVHNMAGKLSLAELPAFLSRCALFIGNDSGPKHIAAGIGIPTIGLHSGSADAQEFGPVGEKSLAVVRQTSCSPCYIAKCEDCHRQMACLSGLTVSAVFNLSRRLLPLGQASQS